MAIINTETDRKGKTVTYATGIVQVVNLDKFAEPKTFHYEGKAIVSTHKASLLLKAKGATGRDDEGVWIGLGDIELKGNFENLQVKVDDKYVNIERGVEVSIDIDKVDEYKGKTYYNTKKSRITVISTEGVQAKAPASTGKAGASGDTGGFKKKDTSGMETGHALNGALYLKRNGVKGEVIDLAKLVHDVTVSLKAEIAKERNVPVTDYDLGASVGHAVLNACRDSGKAATAETLTTAAKGVLVVSDEVLAFIKAGGKGEATKTPEVKTESKPATVEAPVDFEDEIPF